MAALPPVDAEQARLVASCRHALEGNTIRALIVKDDFMTIAAVQAQIEHCAVAYCGAPSTAPDTMKEATRFVESQFSHLTVAEIGEAFRLAAAGRIEADLKAYHGVFSVRILGDVLSAYEDHRAVTFRAERARMQAEQEGAENEARADAMKDRFGTLADQLRNLQGRNTRYPTWQDLPLWFCRRVIDEKLIDLDVEVKTSLWIRAKTWAVDQVGNWLLDPLTAKTDRDRWLAGQIKAQDEPGCFPGELRQEAEAAYAQLLVFHTIAAFTEK